MIEELSNNGDSYAHGLDPRVKIVVVFLFSALVAVSDQFQVLSGAIMLSLLTVVPIRVPLAELFKRLVPVNLMMVFLWLFLPFTFTGEPLFSSGPLVVTREGVLYASRISIKSNAMMLMLIALVASTPIFTLGHAMYELGIPKRLVHLFFFTYRYIHVMHREYIRTANSMKIRGFVPKNSLHTYKTFAYMVGMLLVKSFDRAQRVHSAMVCRGFKGDLYSLRKFRFKKKDAVALVFMLTLMVLLGVLEWKKTI